MTVHRPDVLHDPLAAAHAVAAVAAVHARQGDTQGKLASEVVTALRESGLVAMALLSRDGGPELPPLLAAQALHILAATDPSAAWYAAVSSAGSTGSWFLPSATTAEIWNHGPGVIVGGSARPGGRAEPAAGGVRILEGRWEWGSAGDDATWMLGTVELEGQGTISVYLDQAGFEMESTWDALGLRASASHAFHAVAGTFVPQHLVRDVSQGNPAAEADTPLTRFSVVSYQSLLFSSVALGNAAGALEDIRALAMQKTPIGTASSLAAAPYTWRDLGRASIRLESAWQLLKSHADQLWTEALHGSGDRSPLLQAAARAGFAEAAVIAAEVVQTAFDLAGASAAFRSSPLQRRLRDARVLNQHYYLSPRNQDLYGRVLLTQPLNAFEQRSLLR